MHVLHVTTVETSNYYLNSLAERLHPRRAQLSAVTLGHLEGFVTDLRLRGVSARALGGTGRLMLPLAAIRIAALAAQSGVKIIHAHLFEPAVLCALICRVGRWPLVTTRHHSDAIHRLPPGWRRDAYLRAERLVNSEARQIIAPARMVESILTEREGVAPEKVSVVPYPQTMERFSGLRREAEVRRDLGAEGARILVCVSRLHPEKGLGVLLRALRTLPADLRLYIVGQGPESEHLQSLTRELGLGQRVAFLGWRTDVLSILAAADVVVHPSLHEALPSAVIEGVALGKAVVATDVSGVRDILGDQEYGQIVRPGDVDGLAQAVARVLTNPQQARERAAAGRARLFDYMDPERVAEAHLLCYRRAVERDESPPQPRGL